MATATKIEVGTERGVVGNYRVESFYLLKFVSKVAAWAKRWFNSLRSRVRKEINHV